MRKFLISAALLASTLTVAAPAAAQWAPQGNSYGYGNNNGYNGYGQSRQLEARVWQLRQQIRQLDQRNVLSGREARQLDAEARNLQYRVRQLAYNGIDPRERFEIERQISRLEQRIRYAANDGNNRYGYNNGYNNGGYGYADRDRDGRDDRNEHGRWHEKHDGDQDDDDD